MKRIQMAVVVTLVTAMVALSSVGCGTLMYPERVTSAPSNKNVSVGLPDPAPADCDVMLRLVDIDGLDVVPPTHSKAVSGRPLEGPLDLVAPARAASNGSKLELSVDGQVQVRWSLVSGG
jgi:hypothetical protein